MKKIEEMTLKEGMETVPAFVEGLKLGEKRGYSKGYRVGKGFWEREIKRSLASQKWQTGLEDSKPIIASPYGQTGLEDVHGMERSGKIKIG